MLDQLVESKSGSDGGRRGGFLLTTLVLVFALFFGTILYSLFDKFTNGLGGNEDLELSTLVAPVPVPEDEPPPPEEKKIVKEEKAAPNADVRKVIIQDINESPQVPKEISVQKLTVPPRRPDYKTVLGDENVTADNAARRDYEGPVSTNNKGVGNPNAKPGGDGGDDEPPPTIKKEEPKPSPTPPPVPKIVSGGVVNGKAINLVKPPYPPAAKAVRASGAVNVQVTIDENGNVISASAVSGHALLRQAAESAARASKFSPTMLSGQKVKVTGVIVYNFTAQ
ncbi:MAG: energy transducer TonB [Pyrinomonadaceae bacterium]|nr:energy transducer TonB [Pyrinomonadaceae bacterium]